MTAVADPGLSIVLPGNWTQMDMNDLAEPTFVDAAVGRALESTPELESLREPLVAYATAAATAARDQGVAFAAVLVDIADDATVPVVASLSVAFATGAVGTEGRGADDGPPDEPEKPAGADRGITETTSVSLPCGPAARLERTYDPGASAGQPQQMSYSVQYVVEVPNSERVAVLTFSSPMLGMREGLNEAFDHVAQSVRFE